jgi:hypothetical protein
MTKKPMKETTNIRYKRKEEPTKEVHKENMETRS